MPQKISVWYQSPYFEYFCKYLPSFRHQILDVAERLFWRYRPPFVQSCHQANRHILVSILILGMLNVVRMYQKENWRSFLPFLSSCNKELMRPKEVRLELKTIDGKASTTGSVWPSWWLRWEGNKTENEQVSSSGWLKCCCYCLSVLERYVTEG